MVSKEAMQGSKIQAIYRYPVKGLSAQALARVQLSAGSTLPADRLYAIENGPSGFDPAAPAYFPKHRFLMLMRNERLAGLRTDFDEQTHVLSVRTDGRLAAQGDLRTQQGRAQIERFFAAYCADELQGPPKILAGTGGHSFSNMKPPHSFSDVAQRAVSIINLASVAAVEAAVGAPVDPLRFRGNLYVSGWPAWREFELLGQEIAIGPARLKVVRRIKRCAATNVEPDTGIRDLNIPQTLMKSFGHADCGIYTEVVAGGEIAVGETVVG
ncbi:MAG TPA: MOSC domain-containing protein [Xanthobacteraceae bacterium]|nr:MOSC domain-containing protein [Xanthobacteraceae bacterium]